MPLSGTMHRAILGLFAVFMLAGCQATEGKLSEREFLFTIVNDESVSVTKLKEKNVETLLGNKKATEGKKGAVAKTVSLSAKSSSDKRPYASLIATHAAANNVPVNLAHAVVRAESSYNAGARGSVGEIGLMQLRLSTARLVGYNGSAKGLYDPATNIKYGMRYLGKARQLAGGSTCGTILRYNAGHGAKRMNPISARYCSKVKKMLAGG